MCNVDSIFRIAAIVMTLVPLAAWRNAYGTRIPNCVLCVLSVCKTIFLRRKYS